VVRCETHALRILVWCLQKRAYTIADRNERAATHFPRNHKHRNRLGQIERENNNRHMWTAPDRTIAIFPLGKAVSRLECAFEGLLVASIIVKLFRLKKAVAGTDTLGIIIWVADPTRV
jgi:hypothetical protein